jgi:hypothetical protein
MSLQRTIGNRAASRHIRMRQVRPSVQRFGEDEHKAIGDRARGDVQFRLAPMVNMTYGDMVAMGDYFEDVDEIASLMKHEGIGKGTRGEVYYALFVRIRGEDESRSMGEWFDESAKKAVKERFLTLAAKNIKHFPNPRTGDEKLDVGTKLKRHDSLGRGIGEAATYRDGHLRAVRRAVELGRAGQPVGGALAIDAFAAHFLTDSFSASHIRTPRESIQEYWQAKVPDFHQRFAGWLTDTLATFISHAGAEYQRAAPGWLVRSNVKEKVDNLLKGMPPLNFGDMISGAVHDNDGQRGVVVEVEGRRLRLVGDNRLLAHAEDTETQRTDAETTMGLAVKAVSRSAAEIDRAYAMAQAGSSLEAVVEMLTKEGRGLFAAERMIPRPVPDDKLSPADQSLRWSFSTLEELLEDPRMRRALRIFANNKVHMFDSIMDAPGIPEVAKEGLQLMVAGPMSSTDTATVVNLFHAILSHEP